MTRNRSKTLRPLAAALAAALAACSPGRSALKAQLADAASNETRVAVAVPLSGPLAAQGRGQLRAVQLAFEQANAAKRFPYTVVAVPFDDRGEPEDAIETAAKIAVRPDLVAVIGHYTSGCSIPAARLYALGPVAMISAAATNVLVTGQQLAPDWKGPRVAFRVVPTDAEQGAYAAGYLYKTLGKRRVSILYDRSPYGQDLAERLQTTFVALGGKALSNEAISAGDRDFRSLLARVAKDKPDAVYYGGFSVEAGLIAAQMHEVGLKVPFATGDGALTNHFFDVAGADSEGAYVTMVGVPAESLPAAAKFVADYRARFTGADEGLRPFDHFAYDAAQTVLDALEAAGPGNAGDRVKVLEALRATKRTGLFGATSFDDKGDTTTKTVSMMRARFADRSFPLVGSSAP